MAVDADTLAKTWIAKRDGRCNICNKPFVAQRDRIRVDPGKPTWFNTHSQKESYNYAHVSCVDTNDRQAAILRGETEPAPKPQTHSADVSGNFRTTLRALRDGFATQKAACEAMMLAIDAYLSEDAP